MDRRGKGAAAFLMLAAAAGILAACGSPRAEGPATSQSAATRPAGVSLGTTTPAAYRGVDWSNAAYPVYSRPRVARFEVLPPVYLQDGPTSLAIVGYVEEGLASVSPSGVAVFAPPGSAGEPRVAEVLLPPGYGTAIPGGASVGVQITDVRPAPANPFSFGKNWITITSPTTVRVCAFAPAGAGSVAADKVVHYAFSFEWAVDYFRLTSTRAHAVTPQQAPGGTAMLSC
jgi:hypothetical protein